MEIPGDQNIAKKEVEKVLNYSELRVELAHMWNAKVKVIPIVIETLESIPKNVKHYMEVLDVRCNINIFQKSALLGTAHILKKVLAV